MPKVIPLLDYHNPLQLDCQPPWQNVQNTAAPHKGKADYSKSFAAKGTFTLSYSVTDIDLQSSKLAAFESSGFDREIIFLPSSGLETQQGRRHPAVSLHKLNIECLNFKT